MTETAPTIDPVATRLPDQTEKKTRPRFHKLCELAVRMLTRERAIAGLENLEDIPGHKIPILTFTHNTNLDVPLVDYIAKETHPDFLIVAMSTHWQNIQRALIEIDRNSFLPVKYNPATKEHRTFPDFNPSDFENIARQARPGRAIIIAANARTRVEYEDKFPGASVGPIVLHSLIKDSVIVPVAIKVHGEGSALETPIQLARTLLRRKKASISIGQPIEHKFSNPDPNQLLNLLTNKPPLGDQIRRDQYKAYLHELKLAKDQLTQTLGELLGSQA